MCSSGQSGRVSIINIFLYRRFPFFNDKHHRVIFYRIIGKDIDDAEAIVQEYNHGWRWVMELVMYTHPATYPRHSLRRFVQPREGDLLSEHEDDSADDNEQMEEQDDEDLEEHLV